MDKAASGASSRRADTARAPSRSQTTCGARMSAGDVGGGGTGGGGDDGGGMGGGGDGGGGDGGGGDGDGGDGDGGGGMGGGGDGGGGADGEAGESKPCKNPECGGKNPMKGLWCTAGKCKRHRKDFLAARQQRRDVRWFFVCCECEDCDERAVKVKPMSASWKHARCPHSKSTPQMIHDPAHGGCGKRMLKCKCPGSPVPLF